MRVLFETNMIATQINASVRFSTKLSSVNHFFKIPTIYNNSDDIAVSVTSFNRMIKTIDDSNEAHMAYPNSNPRWNQNFVNGEYVIAYTFDPLLDQAVKSTLPEVYSKFRT